MDVPICELCGEPVNPKAYSQHPHDRSRHRCGFYTFGDKEQETMKSFFRITTKAGELVAVTEAHTPGGALVSVGIDVDRRDDHNNGAAWERYFKVEQFDAARLVLERDEWATIVHALNQRGDSEIADRIEAQLAELDALKAVA